jgi:hypothetical protein
VVHAERGNRYVTTVRYTAATAAFTEHGTRPHPIRPKRPGGLLSFYWPKVGAQVWLRSVQHPGSTEHVGWFSKTTQRWSEMLRRQVGRVRT